MRSPNARRGLGRVPWFCAALLCVTLLATSATAQEPGTDAEAAEAPSKDAGEASPDADAAEGAPDPVPEPGQGAKDDGAEQPDVEASPSPKKSAEAVVARPSAGTPSAALKGTVKVHKDGRGYQILVDGEPFMIRGMNWGYIPIGTNYAYSLWTQPDELIEAVLQYEMGLMQGMGVNAIRQYDDIPPRWVEYIYKNYGIYTMVNNTMGRYGVIIDEVYVPKTNYADPSVRQLLKERALTSFKRYKDTPGLLMYLLGNENNYGLEWSSFEIENLPSGEQHAAKAEYLYSLFGEIIDGIKAFDANHPVTIANGDLQYIDLIAKYCKGMDLMGSNVYRGISSRDLFEKTRDVLDMPIVYTEFGADAYNVVEEREDAHNQAIYLHGLWQEIDEQSYGKGRVGNAVGGFTFQWSDGWWKTGQETNLDVHDTTASWANGGYAYDFVEGKNNMNEEWWGICAKGPVDERGVQPLYPRTAYYVLKEAYRLDVTSPATSLEDIRAHYNKIDIRTLSIPHRVDKVDKRLKDIELVSVSQLRLEMQTFTTGNSDRRNLGKQGLSFDRMESAYVGFRSKPTRNLSAELTLNVLGNVALNPIDDIFYEARGRTLAIRDAEGENVNLRGLERLKIYNATFLWEDDWFTLEGFFRSGHYHWGYEGDFFGIYREANYQDAIDTYDANAPAGVVFTGKKALSGVKVAMGPELYWGANPSVVVKYYRQTPRAEFSIVHQEDITRQGTVASTVAVPEPVTRKTALFVGLELGAGLKLELGGLFAGTERLDASFRRAEKSSDERTYLDSGYFILDDKVALIDTLGTKARLSWDGGVLKAFAQGGIQGLVADAGYDQTITFTGWMLKPSGRGNQMYANGGMALQLGTVQIAPNVLFQRPLVGPLPLIGDFYSSETDTYFPAIRPRNILDDPFVVMENREMLAFELLLAYDPTPATWMWQWDNDRKEDADFAASLDFVYRMLPTSRDARLFFTERGQLSAFGAAPPALDTWDINARMVANPMAKMKLVTRLYGGLGQANGDSARPVTRFGGDARLVWARAALSAFVRVNDWGPYDFHRDFNLTFPLQLMGDLSWGTRMDILRNFDSRFGIRGKLRYLDENSPPGIVLPEGNEPWANEYEVMTYFRMSL